MNNTIDSFANCDLLLLLWFLLMFIVKVTKINWVDNICRTKFLLNGVLCTAGHSNTFFSSNHSIIRKRNAYLHSCGTCLTQFSFILVDNLQLFWASLRCSSFKCFALSRKDFCIREKCAVFYLNDNACMKFKLTRNDNLLA